MSMATEDILVEVLVVRLEVELLLRSDGLLRLRLEALDDRRRARVGRSSREGRVASKGGAGHGRRGSEVGHDDEDEEEIDLEMTTSRE